LTYPKRNSPNAVGTFFAVRASCTAGGTKGYSQTTVADLAETSGVHKPSLYRTFGTEEELFAKILRRFMKARMEMFAALVEAAGPGVDGIDTFLSMIREDVVSGTSRHGCLLVATSTELGGMSRRARGRRRERRDRTLRSLPRPCAAHHQRARVQSKLLRSLSFGTREPAAGTQS
jgi:AcrR family transcriptional regulator